MAADCEKVLASGDPCGVMAAGSCIDCGKAFCPSHQAIVAGGPTLTNLCSDCKVGRDHAARQPTRADGLRQKRGLGVRRIRLAAEELSVTWPEGLVERRLLVATEKRLFGKHEWFDVFEPAWPIGKLSWDAPAPHGELGSALVETGVTAAGQLVPMRGARPDEPILRTEGPDKARPRRPNAFIPRYIESTTSTLDRLADAIEKLADAHRVS